MTPKATTRRINVAKVTNNAAGWNQIYIRNIGEESLLYILGTILPIGLQHKHVS